MQMANIDSINFSFFTYENEFKQPLKTNHGIWKKREGIIIRLQDKQGNEGLGEIAPLPWFGSENLAEALYFCQQLNGKINLTIINQIPETMPCCQFAFQSGYNELKINKNNHNLIYSPKTNNFNYSYLLPTGEDALKQLKIMNTTDNKTFKWKIGVNSLEKEQILFTELITLLSSTSKLRLDANGGLTYFQAQQWLQMVQKYNIVEFIEQPLPTTKLDLMLDLSANYSTPLALDESVANFNQLQFCYENGWKGIFVIKPAICGYPDRLEKFCLTYNLDVVLSSVLETTIGRKIALSMAPKIQNPNRAMGFGVSHWFKDKNNSLFH